MVNSGDRVDDARLGKFDKCSALDLLQAHADALLELRRRGIVRSKNNPAGDYAEYLFCEAFGWDMAPPSEKSVDAIDGAGVRYQIKARRLTSDKTSRLLSLIRNLPDANFDYLAAVLFNEDFTVFRAAKIPHLLVIENAKYDKHANGWRFYLRDQIWEWDGVEDVTTKLKLQTEA